MANVVNSSSGSTTDLSLSDDDEMAGQVIVGYLEFQAA